jgi:7-cyano-7-deazaguanine synthase in queuosine biosynthesis
VNLVSWLGIDSSVLYWLSEVHTKSITVFYFNYVLKQKAKELKTSQKSEK